MSLAVHILAGAETGRVLRFTSGVVGVGRHPDNQICFPDNDLVSARHARLLFDGERWVVRDLGSTNGTFLNDAPVREAYLSDGDRLIFGSPGAAILVRTGPSAFEDPVGAAARPRGAGGTRAAQWSATAFGPNDVAARRPRGTSVLRYTVAVLALGLVGTAGAFVLVGRQQRAAWERERATLLGRLDSVLAAGEEAVLALEDQLEGVAEALRQSQEQVRDLRARLDLAERAGDAARAHELRGELVRATAALERQQVASTVDFAQVRRRNAPAVARVWAEFDGGEVSTATAFAVRRDAVLLTVRHAVAGAAGDRTPRRIAVQFSGSDQVWPARVLARAEAADLALLAVDQILGDVPVVAGLNLRTDTLPDGAAVAIIGYPLGGQLPDSGAASAPDGIARPVVAVGVLGEVGPGLIEVQGYGAAGASGSPIFDTNGNVLGILFGGRRDDAGHTVFAVPAGAALALLERAPPERGAPAPR